ncbi:MAG: site-specific integrase [Paludibacteraceae bacterium]|nr:site-specific integrase [Paludibacteraceae bacterium]
MTEWLQNRINIEESTRANYEKHIRLYIMPELGHVRMQDLRYTHCQEWVRRLSGGIGRKKPLSAKSIHNAAGVLTKALADAVRGELIATNPASNLELPRIEKTDPNVMDTQRKETFLEAIKGNPYERIYIFALETGMRQSEILGLRWSRVKWKSGEIRVDAQLERKSGSKAERELKGTKTHEARTIPVPRYVMDLLKVQSIRQKEWRLKAGEHWANDLDLVFTREDGSPMPHNTISNNFKRLVTRLGMPDLRFHDLRHTFITDELVSGTDVRTTADLAGHSTPTMTLNVYAAATSETKRAAAQRRQERHEKQA